MLQFLDFKEVKALVSVYDLLRKLDWKPTRYEPASQRGPCPIHGSRSPKSRSLSVTRNEWYCQVCKRGGDVCRLYALLNHTTDYQAALALCDLFGHRVPIRRP